MIDTKQFRIRLEEAKNESWPNIPQGVMLDFEEAEELFSSLEEAQKVVNQLIDTTAHLAAAISLLERTPRVKKAAPSDKMFEQMLDDYRNSLERATQPFEIKG